VEFVLEGKELPRILRAAEDVLKASANALGLAEGVSLFAAFGNGREFMDA
jgi:hypothetical protein